MGETERENKIVTVQRKGEGGLELACPDSVTTALRVWYEPSSFSAVPGLNGDRTRDWVGLRLHSQMTCLLSSVGIFPKYSYLEHLF